MCRAPASLPAPHTPLNHPPLGAFLVPLPLGIVSAHRSGSLRRVSNLLRRTNRQDDGLGLGRRGGGAGEGVRVSGWGRGGWGEPLGFLAAANGIGLGVAVLLGGGRAAGGGGGGRGIRFKGGEGALPLPQKAFPYPNTRPQPHSQPPVTAPPPNRFHIPRDRSTAALGLPRWPPLPFKQSPLVGGGGAFSRGAGPWTARLD